MDKLKKENDSPEDIVTFLLGMIIIIVFFTGCAGIFYYTQKKQYNYNDYSRKLNQIEYNVYHKGMSEKRAAEKYKKAKSEWINYYNKKTEKINKLKDFQATVEEYNKYIGDYSNGEKEFSIKKENNRFIFSYLSEVYDILFDDNGIYYYNEHLQRILIGYTSLYDRDKIHINGEKPYYMIERGN